MPTKDDNETTPFNTVWEPGDKILVGIRRWPHLTRSERIDVFLTVVVAICGIWAIGAAGVWLVSSDLYRSPWFLFGAAACGAGALALLVWRQRQSPSRISKQRSLSLGLRFLVIAAVLALVGSSLLLWRYQKLSRVRFQTQLRNSGLPSDLYDYQGQLESLTLQQGILTDLDWLNSTSLNDLIVASRGLRSLNGFARVPELQSLEIDLRGVPLDSLSGLSSLKRLRTLILRNIGRAKRQLNPEVSAFQELKTLDLDFERSSISSLPDLTACQELQNLSFNLRATNAIAELPDLSGLHQLHSLALFLDNSKIRSLKPLARLDHLQTLTLTLDGTQVGLLQGWLSELRDNLGPESLTLLFTTPLNDTVPNLSGIRSLISLDFAMLVSQSTTKATFPDISYPKKLKALTISFKGSEAPPLHNLGNLTGLLKLDLDLEASTAKNLPEIAQLHNLERLTINVSSTAIPELPDFGQSPAPFPELHELKLGLANSQVRSLHGIGHLNGLRSLALDIRGTTIEDLSSITQIDGLEKLAIRLRWSQVSALPDLGLLKNLKILKLELDDWWDSEELPDLSHLSQLKNVSLGLIDSQIKDLSPLEKIHGLEELYLDLQGSSVETLPDLRLLTNLRIVEADIRGSRIKLNQMQKLHALQKLSIDRNFSSLEGLPGSVKALVISP